MGYVLKVNNRKNRSGSKLTARIVTKNHKYKEKQYNIIVEETEISDQQFCQTELQRVIQLVKRKNNDLENKTYDFNTHGISPRKDGEIISYNIESPSDINHDYIDKDGKIIKRPPYNKQFVSENTANITYSITITIRYNNVHSSAVIPMTIKAYTKEEIINLISDATNAHAHAVITSDTIWNLTSQINSANPKSPYYICSNLLNLSDTDLQKVLKDQLAIYDAAEIKNNAENAKNTTILDKIDMGTENIQETKGLSTSSLPKFDIKYQDIYGIDSKNGTLKTNEIMQFQEAYNIYANRSTGTSEYIVNEILANNGVTKYIFHTDKPYTGTKKAPVVAYAITYKDKNKNVIKASITYENSAIQYNNIEVPVYTISNIVSARDIAANIKQSMEGTWFNLPDVSNEALKGSTRQNPVEIDTSGKSICIRIPYSAFTLADSGLYIKDNPTTENPAIGYYSNEEKGVKGFGDETFSIQFKIVQGNSFINSGSGIPKELKAEQAVPNISDVSLRSAIDDAYTLTSDNTFEYGNDIYFGIKNTDIVAASDAGTPIIISFTLKINEKLYGDGNTDSVQFYIKLK